MRERRRDGGRGTEDQLERDKREFHCLLGRRDHLKQMARDESRTRVNIQE